MAQDFEGIVERRRRNYFYLLGRLRGISPPVIPSLPPGCHRLFYPLVVEDKSAVMTKLKARGIETIDFWRHSHPSCPMRRITPRSRSCAAGARVPCHQDLHPEVMARRGRGGARGPTRERPTQKQVG